MQQRTLGRGGPTSSAVGYGAMGTSMHYPPADVASRVQTIRRAVELGVTHIDTAELYGWGESERMVGTAVEPFRDEVLLATKFGFGRDGGFDSRPEHIRAVTEQSLRNLRTDHIDLLYQHRPDPNVPIEEVAGAVSELVDAGKVLGFGLCEVGPDTLRRAHAVHPLAVLQTEYSLFERTVEELFAVLDELGIGLVAYSPLGRGFLTGTARPAASYDADDIRYQDPRWQPGNFEKNQAAVARLTALAETKEATVGQLALAWLLTRRANLVPIPGTRDLDRVRENAAAASLTLDDDELALIDAILPQAHGARYTADSLPTWT
ncbi:MAG TPA: aldo/keto reductase [Friedmanniella sp.]